MLPPTNCAETRDVFTNAGNYLKSFCLITTALTHNLADTNCLNSRMQLYQLDTNAARNGLFNFTNERWTIHGAVLHVAGTNNAGQCANINNRGGSFAQEFGDCNQTMWSFCQFLNIARELLIRKLLKRFAYFMFTLYSIIGASTGNSNSDRMCGSTRHLQLDWCLLEVVLLHSNNIELQRGNHKLRHQSNGTFPDRHNRRPSQSLSIRERTIHYSRCDHVREWHEHSCAVRQHQQPKRNIPRGVWRLHSVDLELLPVQQCCTEAAPAINHSMNSLTRTRLLDCCGF